MTPLKTLIKQAIARSQRKVTSRQRRPVASVDEFLKELTKKKAKT